MQQKDNLLKLKQKLLDLEREISLLSHKNIPISIFNKKLSALESIVKHLKDSGMSYSDISSNLNRAYSSVAVTYRNAKIKYENKLQTNSKITIPITLFEDRRLSILEHIVKYLKEKNHLKFVVIARLLKRDPRTIWTIYSRAKKKGEVENVR